MPTGLKFNFKFTLKFKFKVKHRAAENVEQAASCLKGASVANSNNKDPELDGAHFASAPESSSSESTPSLSPETGTRIYQGDSSRRRKRGTLKRVLVGVLVTVVVLLCGTGAAAALWVSSVSESLAYEDDEEAAALESVLSTTNEDGISAISTEDGGETSVISDSEEAEDPFYVLLLGSDARGSETSRSDVIMLARVDPETATVTLISIPRDTMVDIEGYGTQKINAAYALGGAALAVEVIEEYAGVDISHCAEIYFNEFEELIDYMGGIEVDVPETVSFEGVTVEEGEQTLNGEEALTLARERHSATGGDFGRAQAQRLIVEAMIEKVLSMPLSDLPGLVEELTNCITTDYTATELLELATTFYGMDITFYSAAAPSYSYDYNGVSYVATMYDEWREMMQRVDAGLDPEDEDAEIPEEQLENELLGAATNGAGPEDYEYLAEVAGLTTDDVIDIDADEDEEEEVEEDEDDESESE